MLDDDDDDINEDLDDDGNASWLLLLVTEHIEMAYHRSIITTVQKFMNK